MPLSYLTDEVPGAGATEVATRARRARLRVEELGADGRIVATHESQHLSGRATSRRWALLSSAFTARADAKRVRYVLDTSLRGGWKSGHVTFDDCALEGKLAD